MDNKSLRYPKVLPASRLRSIVLVALCAQSIGCSPSRRESEPVDAQVPPLVVVDAQAPADAQAPDEQILSLEFGNSLPPSRYLSRQATENLRVNPGDSNGYDEDYEMLAYRRLEAVDPNPEAGPNHVMGVRAGAITIQVPRPRGRSVSPDRADKMSSQQVFESFNRYLSESDAQFGAVWDAVRADRQAALLSDEAKPRVAISGLGPVGLLTALSAYRAGASVIGVEKRSQHTRPQILRLTKDTIEELQRFIGEPLWAYYRRVGVISQSPNWAYNKFDFDNHYLNTRARALGLSEAEKELNAGDRAFLDKYKGLGLDLDGVDIIRINHLEIALSVVAEYFAAVDAEHFRLYYGSSMAIHPEADALDIALTIHSGAATEVFHTRANVFAVAEGAGSSIPGQVGISTKTLSKKLYGATSALRLPVGFDTTLRPIENVYGTASVKGIAKIDAEKLVSPDHGYRWSMISEQELCAELNAVLTKTATTRAMDASSVLLPCQSADTLSDAWKKLNGGDMWYLPRTRYFFTGGIAYLGSELTESQYNLFQVDKAAGGAGLREFILTVAKKHMPKQYVEGQGARTPSVASAALGDDASDADDARVVMVTEPRYSLTQFPIELKKADAFYTIVRGTRVVLLGDTYATTHFFTGSGAVNGLRAAKLFGDAIANGGTEEEWAAAAVMASNYTNQMHHKVMVGTGYNSPLDGPYNEPLTPRTPRTPTTPRAPTAPR